MWTHARPSTHGRQCGLQATLTDRATARDLFDLAMVVEREPDALAAAAPFLVRHRDRFLEQIGQPGAGFVATFEAIASTGYRPSLEHCIAVATAYLSALGDR